MKITKRDMRFFLLGILAMFIFVLIYDWDDFKRGLKDGATGSYNYEHQEKAPVSGQEKTQ